MSMTTTGGNNPLVPHDMNGAMQLATMMAKGKLVPQHLRDSPGDCLLIIEQAMRWQMSPFAVAQCTSVIQGKLMFEGKLVAAALNSSGLLESRLREEFSGAGQSRSVKLTGTIRGEKQPRSITVTLAEAKTSNGMWAKQPDQQLVYFATRAWARRHAPEVMLGVYSPEEFEGQTIDAVAIRPEPEFTPPAPEDKDAAIQRWLTRLSFELSAAATADEIDAILARDDVQRAQDKLRNGHRDQLQHLCDEAVRRAREMETSAPNEELEQAAE